MNVESLTVSMFATNCYILSCSYTGEAVVIDPGADAKRISALINARELSLQFIINTHGHIDHIGANSGLKELYKVPILLHEKDLNIYNNPGFGLGLILRKQPQPDDFIKEGHVIEFGRNKLTVVETPGHTGGGISLLINNAVFCGDTLFAGSIGRTDLAGGSYEQLLKSIHEKLLTLPPETIIYPGHGPETTIREETEYNPFLRKDS